MGNYLLNTAKFAISKKVANLDNWVLVGGVGSGGIILNIPFDILNFPLKVTYANASAYGAPCRARQDLDLLCLI